LNSVALKALDYVHRSPASFAELGRNACRKLLLN